MEWRCLLAQPRGGSTVARQLATKTVGPRYLCNLPFVILLCFVRIGFCISLCDGSKTARGSLLPPIWHRSDRLRDSDGLISCSFESELSRKPDLSVFYSIIYTQLPTYRP